MAERLGTLVMAYGTPPCLADVEPYYTDIRGGRPPTPGQLAELTERYRAIGGRSPLLAITRAQTRGIEERLDGVRCYLGQKHASPAIAEAIEAMARDRVERAVGLVLAPHYSDMSVGDYARRAGRAAAAVGWDGRLEMIASWHLDPGYIRLLAARVIDALDALPADARADAVVVFSAHSLPARILAGGDPYPAQLEATAAAVARTAGVKRWEVAWQSAGRTPEPWLEPDLLEVIERLAATGVTGVVSCPCGFVADHLEVLYDVDIEAAARAAELGVALRRTASPNAHPAFLDALAGIVRRALELV
jgi:ferrochelatase